MVYGFRGLCGVFEPSPVDIFLLFMGGGGGVIAIIPSRGPAVKKQGAEKGYLFCSVSFALFAAFFIFSVRTVYFSKIFICSRIFSKLPGRNELKNQKFAPWFVLRLRSVCRSRVMSVGNEYVGAARCARASVCVVRVPVACRQLRVVCVCGGGGEGGECRGRCCARSLGWT